MTQLPDTRTNRSWLHHEPVHSNGPVLDDELLARPELQQAIRHHGRVTLTLPVRNTDRSVGRGSPGRLLACMGMMGSKGKSRCDSGAALARALGRLICRG